MPHDGLCFRQAVRRFSTQAWFHGTEDVTKYEDATMHYCLEASFIFMSFSQLYEAVCRFAKDGGIDGLLLPF